MRGCKCSSLETAALRKGFLLFFHNNPSYIMVWEVSVPFFKHMDSYDMILTFKTLAKLANKQANNGNLTIVAFLLNMCRTYPEREGEKEGERREP